MKFNDGGAGGRRNSLGAGLTHSTSPRPSIAEPQSGQEMKGRNIRTAVDRADADQNVFDGSFCIFHEHVEITVLVKNSGIYQLELRVFARSLTIFRNELLVWKSGLRIFVEAFEVRTGGGRIEIKIIFLDVFAVVPFSVAQSEETLFQNGVAFIPQGQSEGDALMAVAESGDSVP